MRRGHSRCPALYLNLPLLRAVVLAVLWHAATAAAETEAGQGPPGLLPCRGRWESLKKFETGQWCLTLPPLPGLNPFNASDVVFTANVTESGHTVQVLTGFALQNFSRTVSGDGKEILTPLGPLLAAVRYTGVQEGNFSLSLRVIIRGQASVGGEWSFSVSGEPLSSGGRDLRKHGFTRTAPNQQTFRTDSGQDVFLVGENLAWVSTEEGTLAFDEYLGNLSRAGANYARVWLTDGWDPLFIEQRFGWYDEEALWRLDWLLARAAQVGVRLMLTVESFNLFCDAPAPMPCFWKQSPYAAQNDGPLSDPKDFFTDARAQAAFRARLAYIVARYAWSPAVLQWELFNEVDLTSGFNVQGVAGKWTHETAAFLRSVDPYAHLITTSFSSDAAANNIAFSSPFVDLSTTHTYSSHNALDQFDNCAFWAESKAASLPNKPTFVSETGIPAGALSGQADPTGISLHQGLWSGLLSPAAGTAMVWWWDSWVQAYGLYQRFEGAAAFAGLVHWGDLTWNSMSSHPAERGALRGPGTSNIVTWTRTGAAMNGTRAGTALVYAYNTACTWAAANASIACPVTAAGSQLPAFLFNGTARLGPVRCGWGQPSSLPLVWHDTSTGKKMEGVSQLACQPQPGCECCFACLGVSPGFSRDIAGLVTLPGAA